MEIVLLQNATQLNPCLHIIGKLLSNLLQVVLNRAQQRKQVHEGTVKDYVQREGGSGGRRGREG